jgi:hypothetical protein
VRCPSTVPRTTDELMDVSDDATLPASLVPDCNEES